MYFDSASKEPLNKFCCGKFADGIGRPAKENIRGACIVVRQEPPRFQDCFGSKGLDGSYNEYKTPVSQYNYPYDPVISVEEMIDTLTTEAYTDSEETTDSE